MRHHWHILTALALLCFSSCTEQTISTNTKSEASAGASFSIASKADPLARLSHDREMLIDPSTGRIPPFMREKELAFIQSKTKPNAKLLTSDWTSRGPYNIGGRTRAFSLDRTDPNVMLAGAASGGIWKSVDAGVSWYKVSASDANTAVTSLIQDPRDGHELEWYYTTGELFGASQSGVGAFYLGNGVYKSEDGGETWTGLSATQNASPQTFDSIWEGLWGIAIDPSNQDSTEIYVASYGAIWRSFDGGDTWTQAISSSTGSGSSYFTDVKVTSEGVVYATLSYESEIISFGLGPNGGVYRSEDGIDFVDIRPDDYPEFFSRTVIGVDPTDENRVYFLAANVDSISGFQGEFFNGGIQYSALWRYDYLSGDGAGAGGDWLDLTANFPADTGVFDDFYPQSGYDLAIAVSNDNPNTVMIGGTNLYRSTDGFTSPDNDRFIGGYAEHSTFPDFTIYDGHHPDIHGMQFTDVAGEMYNVNDGGIYRTDNYLADTVEWTSLNQGYLTTQVYGLGVDISAASDRIVAGLQDNGNHYVNSPNPTADWVLPLNGDGCYTYFARENDYALLSIQQGRVFKCHLSDDGVLEGFERIDPGLDRDGHDFIHPYLMSPNDDGTVYFPYQNKLYVHRGIDTVTVGADYEPNLAGWEVFADSIPAAGLRITAISASEDGSNRLYLGTNSEDVYMIEDASDINSPFIDLTETAMPSAHVDCIAVDPMDSDRAMVVYTNYGVHSLWYTENAGTDWERVGGNLEQNNSGAGNGPSCRWASIHRWHPDSVVYFVGTSVGLFSTSELLGLDTEWQNESPEDIGNTVVSYVVSRSIDNKVFAGTHGGGVFEASVESLSIPSSINEAKDELSFALYPNPSQDELILDLGELSGQLDVEIYDTQGEQYKHLTTRGAQQPRIDISELSSGIYFIIISTNDGTQLQRSFIKL